MIDPISALAGIQAAVALIKKVSKTVDDVSSLGPVLGKYFDAKSQPDSPRWLQVAVRLVDKTRLLSLREMRGRPELSTMVLLKPGNRLSITPVTAAEWQAVIALLLPSET